MRPRGTLCHGASDGGFEFGGTWAAARGAILTVLARQLKKGDNALVVNRGYRCFSALGDDNLPETHP